ncbi:metallophosphoesterase [Burkholderia pseudomallei]|uniref:metallophosphoesterase n=1 Tax=Burkholderia pseudomallei TaxID=28450 RepID=UPI00050FF18D|nr:metallophosphoesterase [Burkholderia pseudomallei]KGD34451.1 calcineurin-like phosphoesterase family protein [Burkholderia pseudomallei]
MKVQVASDLHHELAVPNSEMARPLKRSDDSVDVLVLAGDIHNKTGAIDLYADYPVPVVYVCGNHEFYGAEMLQLLPELQRATAGTSVHILEKSELVLGNVRFLGCCLWTDYHAFPLRLNAAMECARTHMVDHRRIRKPNNGRFVPEDAAEEQRAALEFLVQKIREPFPGKTVVITHHAPSARSIHKHEQNNPLAPAFASNLEFLVSKADFWIHGHIHFSSDYWLGNCRVICNPRGYPGSNRSNLALAYENAEFDARKVIDV